MSCSSLFPGTRGPSPNFPGRKNPVCRHRAKVWPFAAVLVRQTKPARSSARVCYQVSAPFLLPLPLLQCLLRVLWCSWSELCAGMPSPCGISMQTSGPELKKSTWQVRRLPGSRWCGSVDVVSHASSARRWKGSQGRTRKILRFQLAGWPRPPQTPARSALSRERVLWRACTCVPRWSAADFGLTLFWVVHWRSTGGSAAGLECQNCSSERDCVFFKYYFILVNAFTLQLKASKKELSWGKPSTVFQFVHLRYSVLHVILWAVKISYCLCLTLQPSEEVSERASPPPAAPAGGRSPSEPCLGVLWCTVCFHVFKRKVLAPPAGRRPAMHFLNALRSGWMEMKLLQLLFHIRVSQTWTQKYCCCIASGNDAIILIYWLSSETTSQKIIALNATLIFIFLGLEVHLFSA